MEVFSLMAKLTLDTEEYEKSLQQAESEAHDMDDLDSPSLGLDTSAFDAAVQEAEDTDVSDPEEPELGLDSTAFDSTVTEAESTDVADPESPSLDLDNKPYTDSLDDATSETNLFSQGIGATLEGIKGMIATAGIAVAVKSVVDSLSEAVDLARSMGDNIDKSSRAMSISTDAYQEWSHVMDINGASITDLNRGLMNMRKMLGGGEASKEFTAAMDELGLSAKVANGEITNTEDLLMAAMKTLADYSGEGAQRDYLAQAIFGRGGTKLNAMFDGTSADIDALIEQAHELGLVMTEEEVANAAAYNDAVTNMNASLDAFKTSIVSEILPPLTDVFNTVAKIISFFNWRTGDTPLEKTFENIDQGMYDSLSAVNGTEAAAMTLVDKLIAMGDASKLTAEQQAIWKGTANELISLIPSLSEVVDTDTLKLTANKEEIEGIVKAWGESAKARAVANAMAEREEALAKKTQQWIDKSVEANEKLADAESQAAKEADKVNEKLASAEYKNVADALEAIYGQRTVGGERRNEMLQYLNESGLMYTGDYEQAQIEAEKLVAEAAELEQEINDAQQENQKYAQQISEVLGLPAQSAEEATEKVGELNETLNSLPDKKQIQIDLITAMGFGIPLPGKAKGDWNVPYDMPAMLHRGERVLTASQARQENNSSGLGAGAIVEAIRGLRNDIQRIQLVVNDKTFGRAVVDYGGKKVDNYIGNAENRFYSGFGT